MADKYRVLDLFSGIGGFSLGLEKTGGFETVAFCEIEPFPQKVLAKHWPGVPIYDDVRTLSAERLRADRNWPIDVICGGYPCQPFSVAGKRDGDKDDRHLWPEVRRLLDEIRPAWFIGENVAGHISMGLDEVLSDLEALGYTARPFVIPACAVDAPHRRDRVWIIGHTDQNCKPDGTVYDEVAFLRKLADVADANSRECKRRDQKEIFGVSGLSRQFGRSGSDLRDGWPVEPGMGRMAHGVPNRMDRLKGLGNAVVPQIPEIIGQAILERRAA